MRTRTVLFIVLLLAVFSGGCGRRTPEAAAAFVPIQVKMQKFEKALPGCASTAADKTKAEPCARVRFFYPEVVTATSDGAKNALNQAIRQLVLEPYEEGKPVDSPEAFAEQFLNSYNDLRKKDSAYRLPWSVDRVIQVVRNSASVLAVSLTDSQFTGGAHGNQRVVYRNFRPDSGRPIAFDGLWKKESLPQLTELAERKFRESRKLDASKPLAGLGFTFSGNQFRLSENFCLCDQDVRFRFNAYEVGPYAMGPSEFSLSYPEIKPFLQPTADIH